MQANITLKIEDGKRLLNKFSKPHNPSRKDPRKRILPSEEFEDAAKLYEYNLGDIITEAEISEVIPPLSEYEHQVWLLDQKINFTGVHIDRKGLDDCISIIEQAAAKYDREIIGWTHGAITSASQVKKIGEWLSSQGVFMDSLEADEVEETLKKEDLPHHCRRVLEIRASLGSASVKKLFAILRRLTNDGRLHDLFAYCGADRTGRWAGRGPQPQNLPAKGPSSINDWNIEAVERALSVIGTRNLAFVEAVYGDAVAAVSGCLRGLFSAPDGHELICSDFSAIEAVCLAELAGETWRQEVFRTHGKIYEESASKITGIPFEEFIRHKEQTGSHHPMRKKIGKVAELASGYGGWIGAWRAFGADDHFDNEWDLKQAIIKWREESPAIVEFWGGQWRRRSHGWAFDPELFGLEGAAVSAILNPGYSFSCRSITYFVQNDILFCRLPSGRNLVYHQPRLTQGTDNYSKKPVWKISYMGWNSDYKKGAIGWMRLNTYGGKLCENVTQAVARDILAYAMLNLDKAGYTIVLHVHDEIVVEVLIGTGSIEEIERIMGTMPYWCKNWPIKAAGGWRGKRYRKD